MKKKEIGANNPVNDTNSIIEKIANKKITIHVLRSFPSGTLNMDENGRPKTAQWGGVTRGRISSQCLKYHIRRYFNETGMEHMGVRTRFMPQLVLDRLFAKRETDEDLASIDEKALEAVCERLKEFGKSESSGGNGKDSLSTSQVLFFSDEDIETLTNGMIQILMDCNGDVEKIKKVKKKDIEESIVDCAVSPISIDMALFGRMVTSTYLSNVESAVQMAHAITTHAIYKEADFFTCVDELLSKGLAGSGEIGAGHANYKNYQSGTFYMYSAVDLGVLAENMMRVQNGEKLIPETIEAFIKAFAMVYSKTGQNAFASQVRPALVMVEVQDGAVPTYSYASAFETPVKTYGQNPEVLKNSVKALVERVDLDDKGYEGITNITHRAYWSPEFAEEIAPQKHEKFDSLKDLAEAVSEWVKE